MFLGIGILAVACSATSGTESIITARPENDGISTTPTQLVPTATLESHLVEVTRGAVPPTSTPHSFPIMDVVPLQPKPEFIQLVGPVEYSIVESDFYHFERPGDGISITWAMNGGFESAICVKPLLRPLIEKGDYLLDISDMWERMTLLVDGEPKEPYGSSGFGAPTLLGAPNLLSEEEQETQWLTGTDYCWRAPLETGVHDVVFQIRQTSGDVHEYQWLFEIVD